MSRRRGFGPIDESKVVRERRARMPAGAGRPDLEGELLGALLAVGVPEPETEYVFAPPRRWRLDLAWPDRRVAVEVDGATWAGGRHTRGAGFEEDCRKLNEAALRGWTVVRVTGGMVRSGEALEFVERALGRRE